MGTRLYVGNLPFSSTRESLAELFSQYGEVLHATIATDRDTGRSRGFGFVEIEGAEAAQQAINSMNGTDMGGRTLVVNEARPREARPEGARGGFGGGNGRRNDRW